MKYKTRIEQNKNVADTEKVLYEIPEYVEYLKEGMIIEIPYKNNTIFGTILNIVNTICRCFSSKEEYLLVQRVIIDIDKDSKNS